MTLNNRASTSEKSFPCGSVSPFPELFLFFQGMAAVISVVEDWELILAGSPFYDPDVPSLRINDVPDFTALSIAQLDRALDFIAKQKAKGVNGLCFLSVCWLTWYVVH